MEFAELILTPKLDGVSLHDHLHATVEGTLCLTGHHLIVSSRQENNQELWLLHKNVDCVEKKPFMINNIVMGGIITLKCKDLRVISLEIKYSKEFYNIASSLEQLSALSGELEYPFFYRPMYTILEDGFTIFGPEAEFSKLLTCDEWRISNVNKNFSVCPTYGAVLVVPKSITDEQIVQSASFRDGGRFPVISYRHENGAILLRTAQPLSGQGMKRCRADEAILNIVLGKSKKGFIVDTWGKGKSNTETDQHYSQWKKVNRSIGNVTTPSSILDSFSKLVDACNDIHCSSDKWLSRLEASGWPSMVINSLNAACVVAQCLDQEGSPVLVHGSKGLDSTLIVSSLVQIILNPDCRTVRGLQALVEREWVQAGHPFATRHKHSCYIPAQNRPKSAGASFILFLDCIYQLFCQFPCSFEFNTTLLICLFEQSYFSQYGTFLFDSEKERSELKVKIRTTSLWSYLNRPEVLRTHLNPVYEPNPKVIWPSVAPISFELWTDLYLRWVIEQSNSNIVNGQVQHLITQQKELRTKVIKLRKQAVDLNREIYNMQDFR